MYYVYALLSCQREYIYVGLSQNLKQRISRHNAGLERTTRPYAPFVLLYFEQCEDRQAARAREKYLKGRSGKRYLSQLVEEHYQVLRSAGLSSWR